MLRPTVTRHRHRQNAIHQLREQLAKLDSGRTHENLTSKLSGYAANGSADGPYAGVRLIEGGRQQANGDTRHLGTSGGSDFAGNFAKGLEHAPLSLGGLVDANAYRSFALKLNAIAANARTLPIGDEDALEEIDSLSRPMADVDGSRRPFTNALSGVGALTNTVDSMAITIPPAPEFDSELMAAEMAELYWMADVRDVQFASWHSDSKITDSIKHLNTLNVSAKFTEHNTSANRTAPDWSQDVDLTTLFRGSAFGVNKGPYISQFLLRSFRFGTLIVDQLYRETKSGSNYMTSEGDWLNVQRLGSKDGKGPSKPPFYENPNLRHISTLRDLTHYVHFDALHEAYFNAALILIDIEAPLSPANPYIRQVGSPPKARNMFTQEGFGTFGGPSALVILTEVATRALKMVWHQKWFVHRRLRPEAMGGRIHAANEYEGFTGLVHPSLLKKKDSQPQGAAFEAVLAGAENNTFLLPMAFEEGSPMHPAYGAGHATVAGACVTILKALFEPEAALHKLFNMRGTPGDSTVDQIAGLAQTDANGVLEAYAGTDKLTVEGELNKLAANIAIGRNAAGVHYRSDYTKSLALGEAVAVGLLQELALQVVEVEPDRPVWALPTFAGHWITIDEEGVIKRVGDRPAMFPFPDGAQATQAAPATFAA